MGSPYRGVVSRSQTLPQTNRGGPQIALTPVNWGPGVPKLPVEWGRGPQSTGSLGTPGPQFRGSPKYLDTGTRYAISLAAAPRDYTPAWIQVSMFYVPGSVPYIHTSQENVETRGKR